MYISFCKPPRTLLYRRIVTTSATAYNAQSTKKQLQIISMMCLSILRRSLLCAQQKVRIDAVIYQSTRISTSIDVIRPTILSTRLTLGQWSNNVRIHKLLVASYAPCCSRADPKLGHLCRWPSTYESSLPHCLLGANNETALNVSRRFQDI